MADRIEEYASLGIAEFILSGYPHLEEAYWFGEGVLPEIRRREAAAANSAGRRSRRAGGQPEGGPVTGRQLHFNAYLMSSGHHEAAWRLPESDPFANVDLAHWRNLAQVAERAGFDSLFLADSPALWNSPSTVRPVRWSRPCCSPRWPG